MQDRRIHTTRKFWWSILFVFAALSGAYANAALLLEEPLGGDSKFFPAGHASVYLTNICADTPTYLRRCEPGEDGVVISRYPKDVADYDWLAVPLLPYLYAVEKTDDIPRHADRPTVATLRDRYRRAHLMALAPDDANGNTPKGEWVELVGAAYVRTIYGFEIETTPEQDAAFIEKWNRRERSNHFHFLYSNCADFAAGVMNFFEPQAVRRNFLSDVGIMTPKQAAKSLVRHARHDSSLGLSAFRILQVPGAIKRSGQVRGLAELLVKSKKYIVPLAFLSPPLAGSLAVIYFAEGRFNPRRNASIFDLNRAMHEPLSHSGDTAENRSAPPAAALPEAERNTRPAKAVALR